MMFKIGGPMLKKFHSSYNILGMLKSMERKKSTTKSIFQNEKGQFISVGEARNFLYENLSKGRRVMPMGECDNFDYRKGCLGHEEIEVK